MRTFELPACGVPVLAEWSAELELFLFGVRGLVVPYAKDLHLEGRAPARRRS